MNTQFESLSMIGIALAAGNVDAILPLMSEDVVFLVCGKPPMKGQATFEQGLRRLLTSHRIQSRGEIQELVVPRISLIAGLTLQFR